MTGVQTCALPISCRELKLIIEVDGTTHSSSHEIYGDNLRTTWLEGQGYSIHRVWNQDVYENLDGVLNSILIKLASAPRPSRERDARVSEQGEGPPRSLTPNNLPCNRAFNTLGKS